MNKKSQRQFISFFSGALGLDIGLEKGGLQCLAVNEFDPVACQTINANRKRIFRTREPRVYGSDVRSLTADRLSEDLKVRPEDLFAITGGPPCQAFSTAGRRLGLNDERGNVFLHFIDLILALRPKYAIFENVRGLLSAPLVHRPHSQRGPGFPPLTEEEQPGGALLFVLRRLESGGYKTTFNLYNTANFGVPQVRERLIFFASRDGREVPYLRPTHSEDGAGGLKPWVTFKQAVSALDGKCEAAKFPEHRLRYYRMLEAGQNWRDLPAQVQKEAMGASWFAGGGKTGFYRRIAWNKPTPTLVTSPTMPATDLCHPKLLRPISVEEYAVIQTFPTKYVFKGTTADKYRQIGNAVPCKFAEVIARHLVAFDEGKIREELPARSFSRYVQTDNNSWRIKIDPAQVALINAGTPTIEIEP